MNCRNCDYPLWNITARACPECGSEFKPGEYEFKPGAVKFCCPDCSQEYYGTSSRGHLEPVAFDCVRCSRSLHMDETVLLPADGWDESRVAYAGLPWTRRDIGFFRRWLSTVGWAYAKPTKLISSVPVEQGSGSGWAFFLVTQMLIIATGIVLPVIVILALFSMNTRGNMAPAGIPLTFIFPSLTLVVSTITLTVLWCLVIHAPLKLSGGCAHPIGRTFSCVFFSSGTLAAQLIPCLGPYCFGYIVVIWWLVSAILMVMEGQRVSGLRATFSVLLMPVVLMLVVIGIYAVAVTSAINSVNNVTRTLATPAGNTLEMRQMEGLIKGFSQRGGLPRSPVDLIAAPGTQFGSREEFGLLVTGDRFVEADFLPDMSPFDFALLEGVPLDRALRDLRALERPPSDQQARGDGVRIGALVYCAVDGELEPDPGPAWVLASIQRQDLGGTFSLHVLSLDGSRLEEPNLRTFEEIQSILDNQDALREELGLSPIGPAVRDAFDHVAAIEPGGR